MRMAHLRRSMSFHAASTASATMACWPDLQRADDIALARESLAAQNTQSEPADTLNANP